MDRGDKVIITFSEPIFVHPLVTYAHQLYRQPIFRFLKAAFDVTINGIEVHQGDANSISGNNLTLDIIIYPAARGDEVRVRYNNIFARNAGALLVDSAGNAVPHFSYQTVQNNISFSGKQDITAGPIVSPRELTIPEGTNKTYTVALPYRTSENTTVKLHPFNEISVSPRTLTFTPDDWNVPQDVTVSAHSDNNSIDEWFAVAHEHGGDPTAVWTFNRIVVKDQDTPLAVSGDSSISYSENGTSSVATYSVAGAGNASVSWSVFGIDRGHFRISSTGMLSFKSPPDYERPADSDRDNVYRGTVHASNGSSTGVLLNVAVTVTDAVEKPLKPSAPSVSTTAESSTSLDVTWAVPDNMGRPAISGYDLQYGKGTSGGWTDGPQNVSGTRASITNLDPNSIYRVRIRASNVDGHGDWSKPGNGRTGNTPPVFSVVSVTRSLSETVGGETVQMAGDVGAAVTATDDDDDPLTYTLEGADAGKFSILSGTGQIRTRVGESYDREEKPSYTVIVKAEDGNGGSDTIAVLVALMNAVEKPLKPSPPSVSGTAGSTTSLDVTWTAPDNTGRPTISEYDLQYRSGTSGDWTDGPQNVSSMTASIESRDANSPYQVRVRASNADGDGDWSEPGKGRTNKPGNAAPVFAAESATRSLAETIGGATVRTAGDVGMAVTAADDDDDPLTYSLQGTDAHRFSLVSGTGQIRTKVGESYDREAKASYAVIVKAEDGNGGSDTITVTIGLTDAIEKPLKPSAPLVSRTPGSATSVDVNWTEPGNTGRPALTGYDLQYRKGTSGDWSNGPQDVAGTSARIAGLDVKSAYQVRLRASNADGNGDWSDPVQIVAGGTTEGNPQVPLLAPASHPHLEGFVRVVNRSAQAVEASILAVDDAGVEFGPVTLSIEANEVVHFNSADLEEGNSGKGLEPGTGSGEGNWRLEFDSTLDVEVLSYVRAHDGFVTSMHELAPEDESEHRVVFFNPASNRNQLSRLRLVNPGEAEVQVHIEGEDDAGEGGESAVELALAGGASRTLTSQELESGEGEGLSGALGDGTGKWRLRVRASEPIRVMSLLLSPTGHLTNLSGAPSEVGTNGEAPHRVPLMAPASHPHLEGFVRVVNRSAQAGEASILAVDDAGVEFGPVTLSIEANEVVHFNSADLEEGNSGKGLEPGTGSGEGNWRLEFDSTLDVEVLSYVRTHDGFVTSMHELEPEDDSEHRVVFFNPASNRNQVSRLRLVNPGEAEVQVHIEGEDDAGEGGESAVELALAGGASRTLTSQELESGEGEGLSGALGDGTGKWRLRVRASEPIRVMSLLLSPTGHLTNLSGAPVRVP